MRQRLKIVSVSILISLSLGVGSLKAKAFDFQGFGNQFLDVIFGGGGIGEFFSLETLSSIPEVSQILTELDSVIPGISSSTIIDVINGDFSLEGTANDVLGAMGLPNLDDLLPAVLEDILRDILTGSGGGNSSNGNGGNNNRGTNGNGNGGGSNNNQNSGGVRLVTDPGINETLIAELAALNIMTDSITSLGLTEAGQRTTRERLQIGVEAIEDSGEIAQSSADMLQQQITAVRDSTATIEQQESSQEVLKKGVSSILAMNASNAIHFAHQSQQSALDSQLQMLQLQIGREQRDGTYLVGVSVQELNKQMTRDALRDMAGETALTIESTIPYRLLGPMK